MRRFTRVQLILIVAIVALLAANVYLAIGYFGAVSRKASLQSDIADKEALIAVMQNIDIDALTRQLATAQQRLAEDAEIPQEIDPLEPHIIYVMQKAGIDIYTYNPGTLTTIEIGGGTYKAVTYSITNIKERLSRLIRLLFLVEDLPYNTLEIKNITLTSSGETWNLRFSLVIITQ